MSVDTTVTNLIINEMTKAQYDALATKDPNQIYAVTDAKVGAQDLDTPANGTTGQVLSKTDTGMEWVDANANGDYLPLSGGTMTGNIILAASAGIKTPGGTGFSFSGSNIRANGHLVPSLSGIWSLGNTTSPFRTLFAKSINNGENIEVPTTGGTMALTSDIEAAVPSAGTAGQVLTKTDTGTEWANVPGGGSTGSDNNGLEGDYCSRYGIDDETKSGLPYIGTGNQVIIPAQLQMDVPGVAGLTTNASQIVHDLTATTNCELFLAQGTILEATDVFFQTTEPQNGTTGYAAWWNGTEWKFKSNDTGNVWRAANAVRIAKCIFTGGNLTRLCFTGCRVLNKQEYATARALKLSDAFTQTVANNGTYNVLTTFDLATDTVLEANTSANNFTLTSGVLKVPASPKYSDYTIAIRLSGTIDGGEGTSREFGVQLQRADGTVVAENAVVKVTGNDLAKRAITFATYTKGTADPFSVGGLKLVINNTSGRALNLTGAEILIKMIA